MKLKTSEIKRFLSLASGITSNSILPILDYVKLEGGNLTKSNLSSFVQHKVTAPADVSMLLDEKVLNAFIRDCKEEEFEVSVGKDNQVNLTGGKFKMKFPTSNIEHFPKTPDREKENETELDSEAITAIALAAKNVASAGGNMDFVHCSKGLIFGTDRTKFYCKKKEGLPHMIISSSTATTISKFNSVVYYKRGNYDFYEKEGTLYGFSGQEVKTPDIFPFVMKECPKEYFEFEVEELLSFCDAVLGVAVTQTPLKVPTCRFLGNKLSYTDPDTGRGDCEIEINSVGSFVPDMYFEPKRFSGFMKSLGISTVRLAKFDKQTQGLSVWNNDDPNFFGLVIGIDPLKK